MADQPRPEGQLDVQRWLGRRMLRLQQYEGLMKELLAHHEFGGPCRHVGSAAGREPGEGLG